MTSPTACYVDAFGIHSPSFSAILSYLQGQVQGIFGTDVYLGNDSQDGQLLGIFAQAIYDTNSMAIAVYNGYSPTTAVGVGLSSMVKINGIARELPTNSSATLTIVGQAGTTINSGYATDQNQNQWLLPTQVIIPFSGTIQVTATASVAGAITATAGTITTIGTPTRGWQTVTNATDAVPGALLETDPALRLRQTVSTMLPSRSLLDGQTGNILALPGVARVQTYENATSAVDANGLTPHSVSFVVEGGNAQQIANTIAQGKTPGADTYATGVGSVSLSVTDAYGVPHIINFYVPIEVTMTVVIHLTALNGYSTQIGIDLVNAVCAYINALPIGGDVFMNSAIAAGIAGIPAVEAATFNLTSMLLASGINVPTAADVPIAFNAAAIASAATVTISIP